MRDVEFANFVMARHDVYLQRQAGREKPWTSDPILQRYRFCNMYRELDKVTIWIAENWRKSLVTNASLWFWMLVARLVNNPETLTLLTDMMTRDKWSSNHFVSAIRNRMFDGEKAWGGAYIVSTNGVRMEKASYIAEQVLTPAWKRRREIQPGEDECLQSFCDRLLTLNGVQGFIAGQVIADAKYASPTLARAEDWFTFAISGPGSRRGLNRVMGMDINSPWKEQAWHSALLALRGKLNQHLKPRSVYPLMHAQDVQNCLCEFDKYERVRLGQGKPRSTYPGLK